MTLNNEATATTPYSDNFFDELEEGMLRSARLLAPFVTKLIAPKSVVDVGCGRGAWLHAFAENGVTSVRGLDGDYVAQSKLLIPPECFTAVNLNKPFEIPGRYDLAVCLEVAEHLSGTMDEILVRNLTGAAPAVLFSAAVPGQGGTHHINERTPSYWRAHFHRHGYALLDPIRPSVLTNPDVAWWYRQNVVLFASEDLMRSHPQLEAFRVPEDSPAIEWVHAHLIYEENVRGLSKRLAGAVVGAIRRRVHRITRPVA